MKELLYSFLVLILIFGYQSLCVHASEIGDAIYLWPRNKAAECPQGKAVPQDRCLSALRALVSSDYPIWNDQSETANGNLHVGSFSYTPCGCFLWESLNRNDIALIFDQGNSACVPNNEASAPGEHSYLACTEAPPGGEIASIFVWPRELAERCPMDQEVPHDKCEHATRALVKHDRSIKNNQYYVGSWDFTPCGCTIWHIDVLNPPLYNLIFDLKTTGCKKEPYGVDSGSVVCYAPPPCFLLCNV